MRKTTTDRLALIKLRIRSHIKHVGTVQVGRLEARDDTAEEVHFRFASVGTLERDCRKITETISRRRFTRGGAHGGATRDARFWRDGGGFRSERDASGGELDRHVVRGSLWRSMTDCLFVIHRRKPSHASAAKRFNFGDFVLTEDVVLIDAAIFIFILIVCA